MPIEIKELHIRVAVNTPPGKPPPGDRVAIASAGNTDESAESDKDAIVAECIEQVLQILHDKTER